MSSKKTFLIGFSALAASLQLSAETQRSAPLAPPAFAPAYSSAFKDYKPFEAGEVQDWRKSNDTVRDIGGWRAYAREMRGPANDASAAPSPSGEPNNEPRGSADPHAGHGGRFESRTRASNWW